MVAVRVNRTTEGQSCRRGDDREPHAPQPSTPRDHRFALVHMAGDVMATRRLGDRGEDLYRERRLDPSVATAQLLKVLVDR